MSFDQQTSSANSITTGTPSVQIFPEELPRFPSAAKQMASESPQIKTEKKRRSKAIDAYLREEGKKLDPANHLTILLLGPGDAGKSTVLKQMVLLHGNGFTDNDRKDMSHLIRNHIITKMASAVRILLSNDLLWDSSDVEKHAQALLLLDGAPAQECMDKAKEHLLTIVNSTLFKAESQKVEDYLSMIESIFSPSYVPSDNGFHTENISETVFEIDQKFWHIVDVAGQKDKRSRWTSYMEKKVSGVIFVFSCAAYNQFLEEQPDTNRIVDALQLFQSLVKHPILKIEAIIVLFNKYDLLPAKLEKYQIKDYLPETTGKEAIHDVAAEQVHEDGRRSTCR
ncbi:guanine nucleotide binding protein, alpha subunit [Gorgonomyces haynaldii]|nr:guanine nucleotide binding protein, alpha subunit [Gorgonomyces haynaldii]